MGSYSGAGAEATGASSSITSADEVVTVTSTSSEDTGIETAGCSISVETLNKPDESFA